MSIKTIASGGLVNFTNGLCRVTALVEEIDPKKVTENRNIKLFSALVTIPDTGISLPFDTVLGRSREINNIFDTTGAFAASTSGNEIINERTTSLTFANDFVYYSPTPGETAVVSNNVLLRMMNGESFKYNDKTMKVIGTNGSVKRDKIAISEQPFGELFKEDGKLIIPTASTDDGKTKLQQNTVITAFNKFNISIMLEFMYEFSSEKRECYRYVYAIPGQSTLNEGDDYNKFTSEVQLLCDIRTTTEFFIDGIKEEEKTKAITVGNLAETATGANDVAIGTDGAITFATESSTVLKSGETYKKGDKVVIYLKENKDSVEKSYYVVAETTDGTTWKAMPMMLGQRGQQVKTGSKQTDFLVEVYDFDFTGEGNFIQI